MYQSFVPTLRTLMGPGPSDVNPRILTAMARPTIGHLDPEFIRMMDEIKGMLQYAFQTQNELTLPVSAPGSAGMETCFVNLMEPGDKVIVCQNGVFGGRMTENVRRLGGEAVVVEQTWGRAIDPEQLEAALRQHPDAKIVAFVHAETSTGVQSDAETLCALARAPRLPDHCRLRHVLGGHRGCVRCLGRRCRLQWHPKMPVLCARLITHQYESACRRCHQGENNTGEFLVFRFELGHGLLG